MGANLKRICLNQSVLDFMDAVLTPEATVLEFGSGWSTRWLADRCARLVSIETDPEWADRVCEDLVGSACEWEVRLVDDMHDAVENLDLVDFILLDGEQRLRKISAMLSWPLLKTGGWVILDDAQREVQKGAVKWLTEFGRAEGLPLLWQPGDTPSAIERLAIAWQKP